MPNAAADISGTDFRPALGVKHDARLIAVNPCVDNPLHFKQSSPMGFLVYLQVGNYNPVTSCIPQLSLTSSQPPRVDHKQLRPSPFGGPGLDTITQRYRKFAAVRVRPIFDEGLFSPALESAAPVEFPDKRGTC